MGLDFRRVLYAGVVFWSALLLLLVQPVITKAILPWFGGSAGVWTTSMLFFQAVLLLGYLYAHLLTRTLTLKRQVIVHSALIVLGILLLPLQPSAAWKPNGAEDPALYILGLLATTTGVPYFLLSTTSPLVQSWFSRTFQAALPYRLFAVSNFGSLVALVSYPVLVEPYLAVHNQLTLWSFGFVLFGALCIGAAVLSWRNGSADQTVIASEWRHIATWVALAACPSILWLAVANQLSQDVAAVPFLWIVPLALYLLSFILCFDRDRWYRPRLYRWVLPAAWIGITAVVSQQGFINIKWSALLLCASLFFCCMFCHGELARMRPAARELTSYYLSIAAGGALGGAFVGIIAPRVFTAYLELPIGILGCVLLALWLLYRLSSKRVLRIGGTVALATVAALATRGSGVEHRVNIRNFYGTLQVSNTGSLDRVYRSLFNGTIQHGVQFLSPERSRIPTTYYGPASGAALALQALSVRGPMHVGVIGLGVGTMAAYARPGDRYRFYEINPAVIHLANSDFRYLRESPAPVEVVDGDARLSLEREQPQGFDVLVMDAFSGDSIPVHLLTREAFAQYFRHLAPGGAIAVHVTNKHLALPPVVRTAAEAHGAKALLIHNSSEDERKIYSSSWVVVTRNPELASQLETLSSPITRNPRLRLWTDDYSNLLFILK
jgi:spermidine synthase